jgi:hypothetical protein
VSTEEDLPSTGKGFRREDNPVVPLVTKAAEDHKRHDLTARFSIAP